MTTSPAAPLRTVFCLLLVAFLATALGGCVTVTETRTGQPGGYDRGGAAQDGAGQDGAKQDGDGYAFVHTRDNGEPVRWSTCEPIRYVVREDNAPEGAAELLEDSVRRISEATGLEFSYEGTTDEGPSDKRAPYQPDRYGDVWAPVLITYSDADEYPRLSGRAAGYGGAAYVRAGDRAPRYVSGMVALDVSTADRLGGDEALRSVMLHELAHVVGLAHVDDRNQLMNPVQYGREVTTFQQGDLQGLEILGNGKCYEPIQPQTTR